MIPLKLNFNGFTDNITGYGKANLHFAVELEKLTGSGVSIEWEKDICIKDEHIKNYTKEQKNIVLKPFEKQDIGIIQSTPNFFEKCTSKYRIGFTMIENTHIGKSWVDECNKMDRIFVPSTQLVDIFKKYKVTKPIDVIPEGYDPQEHFYIEREEHEVFTFLSIAWFDERKNWKTMVQAFMSEFGLDEPVRFLFKNNCPTFGYEMPKDKRIKIIDHDLSPHDLNKLYALSDCFVFTTHGEGFGMPILEAMATGLPVILTNWLGSADMANTEYNYPIDPIDINFHYPRPGQQGFMANIDPSELMYWMRHIYEHRKEALEKGKKASEWVRNNWTWTHASQKILNKIKEI